MTEPAVASSDATNIQSTITEDGDDLVLNGHKHWISNAGHPHLNICIFMGVDAKAEEKGLGRHNRHSMVLVPIPTEGVDIIRPLSVFGYEDAPHGHCEMKFDNVRVPRSNLVHEMGAGFAIAQARLGPGRIHHCMRLIGAAERSLQLACERADSRFAFGSLLSEKGVVVESIARSRCELHQARLLTLDAAKKIDEVGAKNARKEIAMIKIVAPHMAQVVIDRAITIHGGIGLSSDLPLAHQFATARFLKFADGPCDVHISQLGKMELQEQRKKRGEGRE